VTVGEGPVGVPLPSCSFLYSGIEFGRSRTGIGVFGVQTIQSTEVAPSVNVCLYTFLLS
jgi:hypothetical protein